jgi:lipoate-protein ligase A
MTGGGVVDHRNDVTYTLCVPRGHRLAEERGAGSYRVIHEAVVAALCVAGIEVRVVAEDGAGDSPVCFEKPVAWDVVDDSGRKMAGAGQRRGKKGLLHQGSVQGGAAFAAALPGCLAREVVDWCPGEDLFAQGKELGRVKYGREEWLGRR